MSDPFPFNTTTIVVVQHRWWDANTRRGVQADVTWTPITNSGDQATPNLVDVDARGWVKTRTWTARPHPYTGYMAVPLVATNDPDLSSLAGFAGYRVQATGETAFTITVDHDVDEAPATVEMSQALAQLDPPVSIAPGDPVRAVWLTELAVLAPPPPSPSAYFTAAQTTALVLDTVDAHDSDPEAHPDIRALAGQSGGGGSTPDATTSVKGKAVLLGGTADAPTVPWSKVTGAPAPPSSLPPSGGAGGVLSGTYPNPGFAQDMATQAELDAVAAAVPERARDALGAALVQGANVTITPDDNADTITISATVPAAYSDEQAQDAFAALIAAGAHSGVSFAYNDAGNAISATVAAQSWSQITGKPTFAAVATSGSAADLTSGVLDDARIPASIARDSETQAAIDALIGGAPGTRDTLKEISDALSADEGALSALTSTVAGKTDRLAQRAATATTSTTATANEVVPLDTTGGALTLTGPGNGAPFGARWKVGTTAATIAAPSGYTINGQPSITMGLAPGGSSGELVVWQAFGTDYQPVNGFKPQQALRAAFTNVKVDGVHVDEHLVDSTPITAADLNAALRAPVPAATRYFFPVSQSSISTNNGLGNSVVRLAPWVVPKPLRLDRIGAEITAAGEAGSKLRLMIYADNGNAYPGALLLDAGVIAADSATLQELTVDLQLSAGLVWIGGAVQAAPTTQPTVRIIGSGWTPPVPISLGSIPVAGQALVGFSASGVAAAAPPTIAPSASGTVPRLFVRLAA